ncbi:alpha-1,2-fucosyltransferase [Brevibacterium senegalense]|uniref:alpha-1,2-fucosyltransferase n=1 Tax=Brevibacterium senegalense TaxID=1033736 RepID=UPI0009FD0D4A|nr:alpha-1,2-fucosyltransferase [Brevibacterium senegalense]
MIRTVVQPVLDLARSRSGAREVQFTPATVRGGNILYYWLWAHAGLRTGYRRAVLNTDHMASWLNEFPVLSSLTTSRHDVRLLDRRTFATRHHFGTSYTADENIAFCRWLLAHTPSFARRIDSMSIHVDEQTCVINVRRGDYYSVPAHAAEFGIDIRRHVVEALKIVRGAGRPTEDFLVVSDDTEWCRTHLQDVLPAPMRFLPDRRDMFDDLAVLAAARSLVLANSTFSYWGSFLARSMSDDHMAVAPPLHQRTSDGRRITDLFDPRWHRTGESAADGTMS